MCSYEELQRHRSLFYTSNDNNRPLLFQFPEIYYSRKLKDSSHQNTSSVPSVLNHLVSLPLQLAIRHRALHVFKCLGFRAAVLSDEESLVDGEDESKNSAIYINNADSRVRQGHF